MSKSAKRISGGTNKAAGQSSIVKRLVPVMAYDEYLSVEEVLAQLKNYGNRDSLLKMMISEGLVDRATMSWKPDPRKAVTPYPVPVSLKKLIVAALKARIDGVEGAEAHVAISKTLGADESAVKRELFRQGVVDARGDWCKEWSLEAVQRQLELYSASMAEVARTATKTQNDYGDREQLYKKLGQCCKTGFRFKMVSPTISAELGITEEELFQKAVALGAINNDCAWETVFAKKTADGSDYLSFAVLSTKQKNQAANGSTAAAPANNRARWTPEEDAALEMVLLQGCLEGKSFTELLHGIVKKHGRSVDSIRSRANKLQAIKSDGGWQYKFKKRATAASKAVQTPELQKGYTKLPDISIFKDYPHLDWRPKEEVAGIMEDAFAREYLHDNFINEGRVFPLPLGTGIGKSHGSQVQIVAFLFLIIKLELAGNAEALRRNIYFLSHSVDIVGESYLRTCRMIDQCELFGVPPLSKEQKLYLKMMLCLLPSHENCVANMPDDQIDRIISTFNLGDDRRVMEAVNAYREEKEERLLCNKNGTDDTPRGRSVQRKEKQYADTLFLVLKDAINNHRDKLHQYTQAELDAALPLLPGLPMQLGVARVAFLTTKKYLYGLDYIGRKQYPYQTPAETVLFIDEFDRQCDEVLDYLLSATPLSIIDTIRHELTNLMRCKLAVEPENELARLCIDKLTSKVEHFCAKWNIMYTFRPAPGHFDWTSKGGRLFLNPNGGSVTSEIKTKVFTFKTDHAKLSNFISVEDRTDNGNGDTGNFLRFLSDADSLLTKTFPRAFLEAARHRVEFFRERESSPDYVAEPHQPAHTLHSELIALLAAFGLYKPGSESGKALLSYVLEYARFKSVLTPDLPVKDASYHANGFRVTTFTQIGEHDQQLDVVQRMLPLSPSGWLAQQVLGGAIVVPLSATLESESVVKNFDINYLRTVLGHRWQDLSSEHRAEAARLQLENQNHAAAGVTIDAQFVATDIRINALLTQFDDKKRAPDVVLNELTGTSDSSGLPKNNSFQKKRFAKLIHSMASFLAAPDNRYYCAYLGKSLKGKLAEFVTFAAHELAKEQMPGYEPGLLRVSPCVNAEYFKHDRFKYDHLFLKEKAPRGKLIVCTTYQSMAEGKNPDYEFDPALEGVGKRLIQISSKNSMRGLKTADIDCCYFERPMSLIKPDQDPAKWQEDRLRLCHVAMSLATAGDLTQKELSSFLKDIMSSTNLTATVNKLIGVFYSHEKSYDAQAAIARIVRQAAGRLARSSMKPANVMLLVDPELVVPLAAVREAPDLAGAEYNAIKNLCVRAQAGRHEGPNNMVRLANKADARQKASIFRVQSILGAISKGHASDSTVARWEQLRQDCLKAPQSTEPCQAFGHYYLELPEPGVSYRYEGRADTASLILRSHANQEMSEEWTRLPIMMKNDTIRDHFVAHGYATSFTPQPFMLTPYIMQAIYTGALGEEAAIAIMGAAKVGFSPLPLPLYECYDKVAHLECGFTCHIDFKNMCLDSLNDKLDAEMAQKAAYKLAKTGSPGAIYLNVVGDAAKPIAFYKSDSETLVACERNEAEVIAIPALIDQVTGETLTAAMEELERWGRARLKAAAAVSP